jgi:hypothetical protein
MEGSDPDGARIKTRIPAQLALLPWSRFHWMVVEEVATPLTAEGAGPEQASEAQPGDERRQDRDEAEGGIGERAKAHWVPERTGMRRFRPGSVRLSTSPGLPVSAPYVPSGMEHEVEIIDRALHNHGSANRRERYGGESAPRYWGPGRFQAALREAVAEGRARRLGGGEYAPTHCSGENDRLPNAKQ